MGAVADFVEDTFDAVGDVFEAVGDVVEDVVDAVGDVVEKVGDVVQAVIDDPLPVLLSVAGSFVGIPPAVTMGAITAARGGDLEDIALSMGTAYFAPSVGNALSSTISSTFIEAGINETFTQVASDSISKGLVNGTIAEIKGGSFDDGFAGGFTGGMVAGGVGEVAEYVKPDVVEFAMESGLDLRDATAAFNSGVKAVSAGVTSEITGRGDFVTSFTNSAIGSGVDAGTRSLNATIDEQFNTAATSWNDEDKDGEQVDTAVVGAGIPNDVVTEVKVSDSGVDNNPIDSTIDTASVLADSEEREDKAGSTAVSDVSVLPEKTEVATVIPEAETTVDFADLIGVNDANNDDVVLSDAANASQVSSDVSDIAENLQTDTDTEATPVGALASVSDASEPVNLSDITKQTSAVTTEAPVSENLLTAGLAADQPVGGLNATATATPEEKLASSQGIKATDFTKPVVATVGNLLKSTLTQGKKPVARAPMTRPVGGLQTATARPKVNAPPPAKMDVAKLIPIQKAAPVKKPTTVGPAKTLASTANLSPVSNIAGLTSLVKKTG